MNYLTLDAHKHESMHSGGTFSTPVFSTPAFFTPVFSTARFPVLLAFFTPEFSTPAFSVAPPKWSKLTLLKSTSNGENFIPRLFWYVFSDFGAIHS